MTVGILLALSFGAQEFLPAIEFAHQARLLLPPVLYFCSSLSVSFPVMLVFAFFTGFVWDARHLPYRPDKVKFSDTSELSMNGHAEIRGRSHGNMPPGYSILFFGAIGTVMQGIRPLFKRGRWELPVVMVGVATFGWLLIEYLLMSFLRGRFYFPDGLWTKLITDALLSMLAAPLLLYSLHSLARVLRFEARSEGPTLRFHGS
jgi:hypothetical protein